LPSKCRKLKRRKYREAQQLYQLKIDEIMRYLEDKSWVIVNITPYTRGIVVEVLYNLCKW